MRKITAGWLWLLPLFYVLEMSVRPLHEPDLFFYFALIENYLSTGAWPITDPFAFTLRGEKLMSLHQWLGYWTFYGPYLALGWAGPILVKTTLVLMLFLIPLWPYCQRRQWPPLFFPVAWALAIFVGHHRIRERVSLWGDVLALALCSGLLWGARRPWFWRGLPLLFLLWTQLHPSYPLGFGVLLAYAACERKTVLETGAWKWMLASVAITLIHPLGLRGFLYPFEFSLQIEPYLSKHVMEWLPLWDERIYPFVFLYLPFATFVPWLLARQLRRPATGQVFPWFLLFLGVVLTLKSVRFGLLAEGIFLLLLTDQELQFPCSPRRFQGIVVAALCAFLILFKVFQNPRFSLSISERLSLDTLEVPVKAAQVLKNANPRMAIFNSFAFGGYLAWAWRGEPPIFFHGFSTHFRFFEDFYLRPMSSTKALDELISKFHLGFFILTKMGFDGEYIRLLKENPQWQIMYEDSASVIFIKKDPRVFAQE